MTLDSFVVVGLGGALRRDDVAKAPSSGPVPDPSKDGPRKGPSFADELAQASV